MFFPSFARSLSILRTLGAHQQREHVPHSILCFSFSFQQRFLLAHMDASNLGLYFSNSLFIHISTFATVVSKVYILITKLTQLFDFSLKFPNLK